MPFDRSAYLPLDAQGSLGVSASGVAFATSTGDVLDVSSYGEGVFRLRAGPEGRPDYGIVEGRRQACVVTRTAPGNWSIAAGETTLEIGEAPLRLRLLRRGVQAAESSTDLRLDGSPRLPTISRLRSGHRWTAAFALGAGEPVYGLGEQFGPLDKRGQLLHSRVEDAQGVNGGRSYKSAPFAWSPGTRAAGKAGAWGLFAHTSGEVTHGVGHPDWSHRSYVLLVADTALDLFLFAADTPADVVDLYTRLTGRAPGVPAWSLGLWVSREYRDVPTDAVALARKLRLHRIPCDVLTLDDRVGWNGATRFDRRWDRERFPDAASALATLRADDFRICVSQSPYIAVDSPAFGELSGKDFLLSREGGMPYTCAWDTAVEADAWGAALGMPQEYGFVDFTNPAAFAWWRDAHEKLFADGVDVVMTSGGERVPVDAIAFNGDTGERLHNVYPLLYSRCLFEAAARFARDADAGSLIVTRAGWAGSQRYPVAAGGEPQSDWEGLAASIRGTLSWGMSGAPYEAGRIGGAYGPAPSAELWLRWLQSCVFGSHLWLDGRDECLPWSFGAETEAIARKWLAFRYRLLPYLQQVIAAATRTGLPVMRAMALAFPGNALVRGCETQFMCGDALLVAPILGPGGEVEIALPPGAWYDLNSRQRFPGLRVLRYRAALDQFPVFGREGHALPLGPAVQHTGEIDRRRPLDGLWLFGPPKEPLAGFTQASIGPGDDGTMAVDAEIDLAVDVYGDVAAGVVVRRQRPPEAR